jgi:Uncharacterized conserved protein
MTWSIVARHPSGAFGVAVASKFFAVGALCPAVRNGKGALSTQALVNPLYARDGLAALDKGLSAADAVKQLVEADTGRDVRQLHVVDASGKAAAHTGRSCIDWCGHLVRDGFSVAGNMLAGRQVLDETARIFAASASLPFAEQLMAAMEAGEAAGGTSAANRARRS